MNKREEFIEKSINIHGNKYDYSKVDYINNYTKVILICKEHGEIQQTPAGHLAKKGCRKCFLDKISFKYRLSKEEFIKRSNKIHNNKYDYSKVNYVNSKTKVIINCQIHGYFTQTPFGHFKHGCCKCSIIQQHNLQRSTTEEFIKKSIKLYNHKYDYSEVNYIDNHTKVNIICNEHGEFQITPAGHFRCNGGCIKCKYIYLSNHSRSSIKEFIEKSNKIHNNRYDYSKVEYINRKKKIIITCNEHGDFEIQPYVHISIQKKQGCPSCQSHKTYSQNQIKWLNFIQIFYNNNIQHAENGGEFCIPETNYKADGYCKETNTIYEYHGDYWHGNPKIYNKEQINKSCKKSFGKLYQMTLEREIIIKKLGYKLIIIWENDWKKINKSIKLLQDNFCKKKQI